LNFRRVNGVFALIGSGLNPSADEHCVAVSALSIVTGDDQRAAGNGPVVLTRELVRTEAALTVLGLAPVHRTVRVEWADGCAERLVTPGAFGIVEDE
jgi:hypothetical protein